MKKVVIGSPGQSNAIDQILSLLMALGGAWHCTAARLWGTGRGTIRGEEEAARGGSGK